MRGSSLREEQWKFRSLWFGIFVILLLFATVAYPPNTLPVRSMNIVLLAAAVWHLAIFFTPLAKKLGSTYDVVAIFVDIVFITWIVRLTGGFQSELVVLYFVELLLAAFFSERVQLLVTLVFSALGLCSSILTLHPPQNVQNSTGGVTVDLGHWKPEDLSALGVRTGGLISVYLIGYVGQWLRGRKPEEKTIPVTQTQATPEPLAEKPVVLKGREEPSDSESLSIISHELRSPLTILRAYTDLLMDPNRQESTGEIVSKIDEEVGELSGMVENLGAILDERKFSSTTAFEPLNLASLMQSLVEKHRSLSDQHQFVFECARREIPIHGDRPKLVRAFSNILGNAIKYSPSGGGIRVHVDLRPGEALEFFSASSTSVLPSHPFAVVKISDSGIGMSPRAISLAFEKFKRLDPERTQGIPGSGLGLYLARKIIEQHQGIIHLDSLEGRGTTVTVALPTRLEGGLVGQ
ncbi:MAG: HAMP domain-containing sensor histidine kinase [Acidobacteriia bacterium]|nr:HAMP domain-containing sensor histidine kinase [Terriglobia bacterium]